MSSSSLEEAEARREDEVPSSRDGKPVVRVSDETEEDEGEVEGLDLDWRDVHDDFDPFQMGVLPSASPRQSHSKRPHQPYVIVEEITVDDLSSVASATGHNPFDLDGNNDDKIVASSQFDVAEAADPFHQESVPYDETANDQESTHNERYVYGTQDNDDAAAYEEESAHDEEEPQEQNDIDDDAKTADDVEEYDQETVFEQDRPAEDGPAIPVDEGDAAKELEYTDHPTEDEPAIPVENEDEVADGEYTEDPRSDPHTEYEGEDEEYVETGDSEHIDAEPHLESPIHEGIARMHFGHDAEEQHAENEYAVGDAEDYPDSDMDDHHREAVAAKPTPTSTSSQRRVSFALNSLVQLHPIRPLDEETSYDDANENGEGHEIGDEVEADEDFQPPPPPSSPPPLSEDEEDDSDGLDDDEHGGEDSPRHTASPSPFEDVIYRAGNDRDGAPIIVFLPKDAGRVVTKLSQRAIGKRPTDQEDLLVEYCVKVVGEVAAKGPYVLVLATGGGYKELMPSRASLARLAEVQTKIARSPHRKNLKKLIVLHPDPFNTCVLFVLKRFVSAKLWRKLSFVRRVADLDSLLEPSQLMGGEDSPVSLPLPEEILQFDITGTMMVNGGGGGNGRRSIIADTQRQARVRAESESTGAPALPASFNNYWQVASSFGAPLATLAARSPFGLPSIVMRTVTYLCLHGVKVPGIFRIPGNADTVAEFKKRLDAGTDVDLGGYWSSSGRSATVEDVHVCAALLKMFFRDLPKPIVTHAAYTSILRAASQESDTFTLAEQMREICSLLPKCNRALMQFISFFIQYLLQHERFNSMTAQNLAIVWVPNLFRDENDPDDPSKELRMLPHAMKAALTMFTHPGVVFPVDEGTVLPICYSMASTQQLPVEEVCIRDVTQPDLANLPLQIEEREFDALVPKKILPTTSFSLRAIVTDESMMSSNNNPESSPTSNSGMDSPVSGTFIPESLADLDQLSVRDLKRFLVTNGYDPSNCVEKSDLRKMARECFFKCKGGIAIEEKLSLRRSSSFDLANHQRKRKSLEQQQQSQQLEGGIKRNSDLGSRGRRDSDLAFTFALKQAGMAVDASFAESLKSRQDDDDDVGFSTSTSSSSPFSTGKKTTENQLGGAKRDFSQVAGPSSSSNKSPPSATTTSSGGGNIVTNLLRRKSLLTRENKRDLAKSAKGIGGFTSSNSSPSSSPHLQSPTPPYASKLSTKRTSSSEASSNPLEETARALKETPLFGENRDSSGAPRPISVDASHWKMRDVDTMGIKDLKALIAAHGRDMRDCRTIEDLRERAKEVLVAAVVDPFFFAKANKEAIA